MYEYRDTYIIDFRNIRYYSEMHLIIKEALDFPDYYGQNWSAFWDCLTDMVDDPIHIQIHGIGVLDRKFPGSGTKMLEILERLRHWQNDRYFRDISIKVLS